jgi:hypothetical protein
MLAAPSLSRADITITVYEVDSGGNQVGAALGTFTSLPGQNNFTISGVNTDIFNISSLNSTLTGNGTFGSLSTSFTLTISDNFNQAAGNGLQFVITATGASNSFPGQPASFTNNAGASSGIAGTGGQNNIAGINSVTAVTTVEGSSSPPSNSQVGDTGSSTTGTTNGNVANLPNPYSILQTINVYAIPVNDGAVISFGATFAGTASSTVTANSAAIPAPGGLILALAAIPVLGARRYLRRKAETATA